MRSEGYQTKGKQHILTFLEEKKDIGVSVLDIADYLEKLNESTNITTIYRQLDKLVAEKKVIKHTADDGKKSLFQYVADDTECFHHLHIQCTNCSKIIHLDCEDSKEFTDHLCKEHGIKLDYSKTVLYGLCSDCQKNQ